jgi:hypothetical protein
MQFKARPPQDSRLKTAMNDWPQILIVILVVGAAGAFLLRLTIRSVRGQGGGCGCGSAKLGKPRRTDLTIDGKSVR